MGHHIAARFNGPTEAFNHFAQDANFNRRGYRWLEDEWTRDKRAGNRQLNPRRSGLAEAPLAPVEAAVNSGSRRRLATPAPGDPRRRSSAVQKVRPARTP